MHRDPLICRPVYAADAVQVTEILRSVGTNTPVRCTRSNGRAPYRGSDNDGPNGL